MGGGSPRTSETWLSKSSSLGTRFPNLDCMWSSTRLIAPPTKLPCLRESSFLHVRGAIRRCSSNYCEARLPSAMTLTLVTGRRGATRAASRAGKPPPCRSLVKPARVCYFFSHSSTAMAPQAFRSKFIRAARPPGSFSCANQFLADSPHRPSSRPRRSGRGGNGQVYKCGDLVRETGIYEVSHDRTHRTAHEVVMLAGDAFPPCETCESRVRFRLLRTAPYIFQDQDFSDPEE